MCFEVLGFDVMLDHKLNPYLLEINYTPSFTADTPLDRYIKKSLITDTLNLVNATQKWKKEMKAKRDKEIQERMMTGKRKKYTPEEKIAQSIEESKKRDEHQRDNLGRYAKIFMLNETQFNQYKKFYDFSMEIYNSSDKLQNNPSMMFRNSNKEVAPYNNYFEPKTKQKTKKQEKENLKNNSRTINESK